MGISQAMHSLRLRVFIKKRAEKIFAYVYVHAHFHAHFRVAARRTNTWGTSWKRSSPTKRQPNIMNLLGSLVIEIIRLSVSVTLISSFVGLNEQVYEVRPKHSHNFSLLMFGCF